MQGKPVPDFSLPSAGAYFFCGISREPLASRERFKQKIEFPFESLSDGKQVRDIERSTFVVGRDGVPAREWRGVKVPGHVQEVLNFAKAL